jgi:hypothetical protein
MKQRGWTTAVKASTESTQNFIEATGNAAGRSITVGSPGHIREQLMLELMTPENVVALTCALMEIIAKESDAGSADSHIVVPADERAVWEQYG